MPRSLAAPDTTSVPCYTRIQNRHQTPRSSHCPHVSSGTVLLPGREAPSSCVYVRLSYPWSYSEGSSLDKIINLRLLSAQALPMNVCACVQALPMNVCACAAHPRVRCLKGPYPQKLTKC